MGDRVGPLLPSQTLSPNALPGRRRGAGGVHCNLYFVLWGGRGGGGGGSGLGRGRGGVMHRDVLAAVLVLKLQESSTENRCFK